MAKVLCPPSADLVWADIRGIRCPVPLNDLVGRSMYLMGDLDPKLTWVIDRVLSPGDTALDAGANLGLMTALIASRVGEHGRVLAFEPSPLMQERLRRMKAANPGIPVELFPVALGRAQGESELRVPPGRRPCSTTRIGRSNMSSRFAWNPCPPSWNNVASPKSGF
ncbi:FkbM family methyltransferase [Cereibacter ovatus]|uniref:FkbM family methyltransferase n=1 Tax=Cereibacter ovatus TaxID=439529 RepID=UPI00195A381F|nr:FkbM family methyltransferase [Cereibacter ovatus]